MAWNWNNSFQGAGQGAAAGSAGGPWGAVAGGVAGGLLGGLSEDGNATSARAAEQQFYNQLYLQDHNQKWNEYMSNTAHQREVADLKAAGLNPVLSANSGAAMGSVGTGQAAMEATAPTNAVQKMQLLLTAKQIANETKKIDNETKQTNANIDKIEAEKQNIKADTENKKQSFEWTPKMNKALMNLQNANSSKIRQEAKTELERTGIEEFKKKMIDMDYTKRDKEFFNELEIYKNQMYRQLVNSGLDTTTAKIIIDKMGETIKNWSPISGITGKNTNYTQNDYYNMYQ